MKVLYFGDLAQKVGDKSAEMYISGATVGHLREYLVSKHGEDTFKPNTLCAINYEFVKDDYEVKEHDEVAFFPPVTGG